MNPETDQRYMALAIALGARGLGRVWPNPAVGCVIVKKGRIVGRGWTGPGGRPHAEALALAHAGAAAHGATAYVSLEPCAHQGQTPPCAGALISAGIARVVSAMEDPDPRVQGRGHALLQAAGIAVETGVLAKKAAEVQQGFLTRIRQGRPMLTLKLASSFDGRIATASGESKWITGPEARLRTHAMRAEHDAVFIGAGTARADDPMLTVRGQAARGQAAGGQGTESQPVRIVASNQLDLPEIGALARSAAQVPLWILHSENAPQDVAARWRDLGARLILVANTAGRLDPHAMLAALGQAGLTRVFCEGGGQLAAALLKAGLVDRLTLFTAGLGLGGDARPAVAALECERLADTPRFHLQSVEKLGPDSLSLWHKIP